MKCGTSSLYKYLLSHCTICPCVKKEPEFFSEKQGHRYNDAARYEDLWKFDPSVHRYALEASTGYTKYPQERDVAKRIYQYGLKPRFIYVVRDPVQRILSEYRHYLHKRSDFDPATPLTADIFVNSSNYFVQLQQYRPYFDRDCFLILDFDELTINPRTSLTRVYQFLDISDQPPPCAYPTHNQTVARSEAFVERHPLLKNMATIMPKPVRSLGKQVLKRILSDRVLSRDERGQILKMLAEDMARFQQEYGFDVSRWI